MLTGLRETVHLEIMIQCMYFWLVLMHSGYFLPEMVMPTKKSEFVEQAVTVNC